MSLTGTAYFFACDEKPIQKGQESYGELSLCSQLQTTNFKNTY